MKSILILLIFSMFFVTGALAENGYELEVISLKHRSAEELLPVIRPLLADDEMVSGMNYQLILRASPRSVEQIKRLLTGMDTLPRRLKITVMQDVDSETVARLTEFSGSVRLGRNARLSVPGNDGANVGTGQGQDGLNARIISTRSLEEDHKTQQLQVTEGGRARITTGQNVAVPVRQVVQTPWGTQVIDTTEYRDVASGFYVVPRLNGDRVTLEISTQNDSLAPNRNINTPRGYPATGYPNNYPATRVQNTSSVVSGRLGEWINIGGLGQQSNADNSTFTSRGTSRLNEQRNVLIKVEEVE